MPFLLILSFRSMKNRGPGVEMVGYFSACNHHARFNPKGPLVRKQLYTRLLPNAAPEGLTFSVWGIKGSLRDVIRLSINWVFVRFFILYSGVSHFLNGEQWAEKGCRGILLSQISPAGPWRRTIWAFVKALWRDIMERFGYVSGI